MGERSKALYEMKKKLRELSNIAGSGTELISVYIPPKYSIAEVSNKLKAEYGQASNIKSKSTRKNVLDALEKIINYLKMFREPPENGIAIFCGNVSKEQGKPDIQLFSISPPEPIHVQLYRCDSSFFLQPLEEMLEAKDTYGLVVMDGREATIAILKGKQTKIVRKLNSTAHSKLRGKGGQSARRFERLVEEAIEKYYKRIGEAMDEVFLNIKGLKGVIVGGPGPAKEDFMKLKPFNYQLNILGVVDTGYTEEYGVKELTEKAEPLIAEQEAVKEKILLDRFMKEVVKDGLATYGEKEVRKALEENKVDLLLLSEGLNIKRYVGECTNCGKRVIGVSSEPDKCECGGRMKVVEERELADELIELAESKGVKIEMISTETSEGSEFLQGFRGIGAFLRYR
ncbi:MAG: peptide chain release factor aRF-1 [Candidatus Micrarchaeia archaeon]